MNPSGIFDPFLKNFFAGLDQSLVTDDLNGPLLPYVWPESYGTAKLKFMAIGQQGKGAQPLRWSLNKTYYELVTISKIVEFDQASEYRHAPFWSFTHAVNEHYNGKDGHAFIWSNLLKIERNNSHPIEPILSLCIERLNTLSTEFDFFKPDFILFLTGPRYDGLMKMLLEGLVLEKATDKFDIRAFARVVHPKIPCLALRIYHPAFLRRRHLETQFREEVIRIVDSDLATQTL